MMARRCACVMMCVMICALGGAVSAQQANPGVGRGAPANAQPTTANAANAQPVQPVYLIPQVQMIPPALAPARRQQLAQQKPRAALPALRQKVARLGDGRLMWRLPNGQQRALVPMHTIIASQNKTPAQVPQALRRYAGYVSGGGGAQPPASHSLKARQSPVRDQGDRGTCVAFGVLAALEAAYGGQLDLSEQDAWFLTSTSHGGHPCMDGSEAAHILEATGQHGIALESHWAYQSRVQMSCPANINNVAQRPAISRPSAAQQNARWGPVPGQFIVRKRQDNLASDAGEFANNPRLIEAWLAAGYEVMIGVRVAADLSASGVIDVTLGEDGQPLGAWAGHEMLIVGYNRAGGGTFEVKNSWGTGAGAGGYVRLSYDYIRTYATEASVVVAVRQGQATLVSTQEANPAPAARSADATQPRADVAPQAGPPQATPHDVIPQKSLTAAQRANAQRAKAALVQYAPTRSLANHIDDQCRIAEARTVNQEPHTLYVPLWDMAVVRSANNHYLQCPGTQRCVVTIPTRQGAPRVNPTDWIGLRMSIGGTAAEQAAQHDQATALWQAMIDACR